MQLGSYDTFTGVLRHKKIRGRSQRLAQVSRPARSGVQAQGGRVATSEGILINEDTAVVPRAVLYRARPCRHVIVLRALQEVNSMPDYPSCFQLILNLGTYGCSSRLPRVETTVYRLVVEP